MLQHYSISVQDGCSADWLVTGLHSLETLCPVQFNVVHCGTVVVCIRDIVPLVTFIIPCLD